MPGIALYIVSLASVLASGVGALNDPQIPLEALAVTCVILNAFAAIGIVIANKE